MNTSTNLTILSLLTEAAGWIGMAGVLINYMMMTSKRWSPDSAASLTVNVTACVLLGINSLAHHALPPLAVNIAMIVVSLAAARKTMRARRTEPAHATVPRTTNVNNPGHVASVGRVPENSNV